MKNHAFAGTQVVNRRRSVKGASGAEPTTENVTSLVGSDPSPLWVRRGERKIGTTPKPSDPFAKVGPDWTPNVMRTARPAADDSSIGELNFHDQRDHALRVLWARHALFAMLFLVVLFLPEFGGHRMPALFGVGAAWIPLGLLLSLRAHRLGRIPPITSFADAAINLMVVAAAPGLVPYGIVMGLGQMGVGIVAYGTVSACLAASALVAGLAGIVATSGTQQPMDLVMLSVFGAFVPSMAYLSSRLRHLEMLVRFKYADLLDGLDAVVWEADPTTLEMTFVSPKARAVFGLDPTRLRLDWYSYVHPDDRTRVEETKRHALAQTEEGALVLNYRMIGRDGETIVVRDAVLIRRNDKGTAMQVRGVVADVTFEQQAQKTIQKQAQYDTLTRLPNRSLFNEELERRLDESSRSGKGTVVLLLDLNGFKEVNDTLGHAVGDLLLQAIAGRLAAYLPGNSSVARLGGDEFAVSLSPASLEDGQSLADTIAAALTPGFAIDQMTIQAAAAIGISRFPDHGDSPSALLRRADAAMYEAKRTGRSYVVATADDDAVNLRRLELLGELRAAIVSGDFRLYHQPKIDVATGRVVGTEGLVRWEHPRHGLLTPQHFVELSELSGLIQPLTRWVIEQGVKHLADWRANGIDITVALNMSVRNLFDNDLVSFISNLLQDYNVPGDRVVLEITESEVMADRAIARHALHAFRSLGVKIAIDDFGTGFSSLSQLQQLPIDEIKIDQSFVRGMLTDHQDFTIVRSIIDLGHNLGLGVVVEGVEEERQLRALQQMGSDRAQGYFIARPMPAGQFVQWFREYEPLRPLGVLERSGDVERTARRPLEQAVAPDPAPSNLLAPLVDDPFRHALSTATAAPLAAPTMLLPMAVLPTVAAIAEKSAVAPVGDLPENWRELLGARAVALL